MVALLTVSALSLVAFGAAGAALAGLRGTCARACDRDGRPLCERCPRNDETHKTRAARHDPLQREAPPGTRLGSIR
jgi:hypothetical protein